MDGNIVKLIFNAAASGSGWNDVKKRLKEILSDSGKLAQGIGSLGGAFGSAGMIAGRAFSMLMQGGVWGFAAEGIKFVINKLGIFKDKSEEVRKTLEDQKKAHVKLLESITTGYSAALTKIDDEAKKRKELIELTNRQTKAQLELKRAQAIMSGDTSSAAAVDEEIKKQDGRSAVEKADADVASAEKRVQAARDALAIAQKTARKADDRLVAAEDTLRSKAKPVEMTMQSSAGTYVQAIKRDTTAEQAAVKTAQAEADAAEEKVEAARKALEIEMQGLRDIRKVRETVLLEQEAAEQKAVADKRKAEIDAATAKAKAESDKRKAFDEQHKKNLAAAEDERRRKEEEDRKEREQFERESQRKLIAEGHRERLEALNKEADLYRQKLADANDAVTKGWENYRDPSKLDQAGERRKRHQQEIDDDRFAKDARRLLKRNDWRTADNLSNRERATRDLLIAREDQQSSADKIASIDNSVKELVQKIEELTSL